MLKLQLSLKMNGLTFSGLIIKKATPNFYGFYESTLPVEGGRHYGVYQLFTILAAVVQRMLPGTWLVECGVSKHTICDGWGVGYKV
jgi:hypothetical protein